MRESLRDVIRRVLSGSLLVGGTAAPAAAAAEVVAVPAESPPNQVEAAHAGGAGEMVLRERRPRLILKRAAEATLELVSSHRSHRSHSSHRSHYSSSGGRTTPSRPRPSPPVYTPPGNTYSTAEFGQRVLRRGMRGADVAELMRLLVAHGHLSRDSVNTEALFTRAVEDAVRAFQRSRNVTADGIVGATTALLLRRRPDGN